MPPKDPNRRNFLRKLPLVAAAMAGLPASLRAANIHSIRKARLSPGATILMQGDSITDAHRDRAQYYPNDARGMGVGYVHHIVTEMLGRHPRLDLHFYNRGISGNKVFQLADRWEDDCLNLQPHLISILIGVNDYWHTLNGNYDGTVEIYETDFRALLDRTRKALPDVGLVIGEPFAVRGGRAISDAWRDFGAYRRVAREIAQDYGAVFLPYQRIFDEALEVAPVAYWCPDGVHPSLAGARLMAAAWLEGVSQAFDL